MQLKNSRFSNCLKEVNPHLIKLKIKIFFKLKINLKMKVFIKMIQIKYRKEYKIKKLKNK